MFNKLFSKILDSSVWLEPTSTRIVWITLLAAMDETGYAHFSALENLAARARVTLEEAEAAVKCFLSPDPESGDPDNGGRRVERVPGGFMVLNAEKHRAIMNRVIQNEQTRVRVANWRAKKKKGESIHQIALTGVGPSQAAGLPDGNLRGAELEPTREMALAWMEEANKAKLETGDTELFTEKETLDAFLFYARSSWVDGRTRITDYRVALEQRISRERNFAHERAKAAANRIPVSESTGRNKGTCNEGTAHLYRNVAINSKNKPQPVSDVRRPGSGGGAGPGGAVSG